ncbi:hypothetical protein ACFFX0_32075 [Citricoccus parietis]|uniref:Uncharacterized protein n=1 Tax=Citricoccus parietis TaxID=592307 RepID=A0ABV5GAS1_9MICC
MEVQPMRQDLHGPTQDGGGRVGPWCGSGTGRADQEGAVDPVRGFRASAPSRRSRPLGR